MKIIIDRGKGYFMEWIAMYKYDVKIRKCDCTYWAICLKHINHAQSIMRLQIRNGLRNSLRDIFGLEEDDKDDKSIDSDS